MTFTSAPAVPAIVGAPPSAAASPHPRRFTVDGSDRLEHDLARLRGEVRSAILHAFPPGQVEGILLGGGYGRGEGGVLRTKTGDRPYNDLEFYVALRGNRLLNEIRHAALLRELSHGLSLVAGIEVEFKILSLHELRTAPVTMFSYDLVMGHRWAYGDDRLLARCEHHHKAAHIPPAEATRLLLNRCSGLLFARERLERSGFTADDADFVGRNLAKARLALGDAVLAVLGRYHWSCRERRCRLREVPLRETLPAWLPAVLAQHDAGVEFKLHPHQSTASRASLLEEHRRLAPLALAVWLWLESHRLARPFRSPRDYACGPVRKCPGTSAWRNLAVNLRTFGPNGLATARAIRYPRERLCNALTLLLWEPAATHDPALRQVLHDELRSSARTPAQFVTSYEQLWARFR